MSAELAAKAERLRALHVQGKPVVLPNAWDVASARHFARQGIAALATTSAGVANALGFPDGEAIPPREIGRLYARAKREGLLVEVGTERSDDRKGKNAGRHEPVYELVGVS